MPILFGLVATAIVCGAAAIVFARIFAAVGVSRVPSALLGSGVLPAAWIAWMTQGNVRVLLAVPFWFPIVTLVAGIVLNIFCIRRRL